MVELKRTHKVVPCFCVHNCQVGIRLCSLNRATETTMSQQEYAKSVIEFLRIIQTMENKIFMNVPHEDH